MNAIDSKYADLRGTGDFLGKSTTDERPCPDGAGRFRHYEGGSIYWHPATGAHEVHGLIRRKWGEFGWERGAFGYPVSDEKSNDDGIGRHSHFQHGSIYWIPARDADKGMSGGIVCVLVA